MNKHLFELGKDFLSYGLMAALSSLASLILLPVFTRSFSPGEYGIIDIIAALTSILGLCMSMALPGTVQRYFLTLQERERRQLISSVVTLCAGTALVVFMVTLAVSEYVAAWLVGDGGYGLFIELGVVAAALAAVSRILESVLRIQRRIVSFSLGNIIFSVSYTISAVYLVMVQEVGVLGAFIGLVIGESARILAVLYWTRDFLCTDLSWKQMKKALNFGLPLLPALVVNWVNAQSDRLILLLFLGLPGVGVFGAAARVALIAQFPATMFQQAWFPHAMSHLHASTATRNRFYARVFVGYATVFAALGLVVTAFSREIFGILVTPEYLHGYVIVPWLIGAAILHISGNITALGIVLRERTYGMSVGAWTGAIVNIALAIMLIPRFGIGGAAIGMFIAELCFTTIVWQFSRYYSDMELPSRCAAFVIGVYVVAAVSLNWLASNVPDSMAHRASALAGTIVILGMVIWKHRMAERGQELRLKDLAKVGE